MSSPRRPRRPAPPATPPASSPAPLTDAQREAGIARVMAKVNADIARVGFSIILTEDPTPAGSRLYAYTIGLTATYAHPELLLAGLPGETLFQLLHDAVAQIKAGARIAEGVPLDRLVRNFSVMPRLIARPNAASRLAVANRLYGPAGYAALQLVWPDPAGRFPWDPAFDSAFAHHQPILYRGAPPTVG